MGKLNDDKLVRLFKMALFEAGPMDTEEEPLDGEPTDTAAPTAPAKPAAPAAPSAAPAPVDKSAVSAPPKKVVSAPAAPTAPDAAAPAPAAKPVAKPAGAAPAAAAAPSKSVPSGDTAPVAIPGMDNDKPVDANAASVDAEQKVQQAKVKLFFDKLAASPQIMGYLKFTNPLEQVEAIQRFAELVGVPKGQLSNVLAGIQQASSAQMESKIRRLIGLIRESSRGHKKALLESKRDTTWAVKQIEEFVAKNENQKDYGDGDDQYKPTMKLFGGSGDTKHFNMTFAELKAIAKLLRRLGGTGGGGQTESIKRK